MCYSTEILKVPWLHYISVVSVQTDTEMSLRKVGEKLIKSLPCKSGSIWNEQMALGVL